MHFHFNARRNCPSVMCDSRSWVGRLFHTWGPAAVNERSPRRVLVRCVRHVSMSDECSCRIPVTDTSWQSLARYAGRRSCSALYTSTAILNCTRWRTGSQCSCCKTGVICSCLLMLIVLKRQLKTFVFDNSFFVTIYFNYVPCPRSCFAYATLIVTF